DAAQRYAERVILAMAANASAALPQAFINAFRTLLADARLDPAFRAQALALPTEPYLLERMAPADPAALRAALVAVMGTLGRVLASDWQRVVEGMQVPGPYRYQPADAGKRALVNLALRYLCAGGLDEGLALAEARFAAATNMTERFGALAALVQSSSPARAAALGAFQSRYRNDALVLDKWFAL
ncbi:aminopeptidase N C-terminal domain-containing protein, partial [Arthrospira platensis SPKY1]|nr:aminopeptidase N C-terminal domain-containing protein [Arthrospira platensis SPKY1]